MREYIGLFRGKHPNGMWVYGSLATFRNIKNEPYTAIIPVEDGENQIRRLTRVDPETVGECTGLKDKNGKLIFDGDIISCWSEGVNAKGTVQRRVDGLWFIFPAWQKHIMWGLCPDKYTNTTVEIIGNIYDNPKLVERRED